MLMQIAIPEKNISPPAEIVQTNIAIIPKIFFILYFLIDLDLRKLLCPS